MMSKAPRWQDTLVNKAAQKKIGKDPHVSNGKQGANTRRGGNIRRSHSFGFRDLSPGGKAVCGAQEQSQVLKDRKTPGSRSSSSLPSSSFSSLPSSSFSSLPSSSFSSLHSSSFIRGGGSRSLHRLDRRDRDAEKSLSSGKFSTSLETLRDRHDSPVIPTEEMKTSVSDQSIESSAACLHHSNNGKKQSRDGVYSLCAVTSGMRRNWVQAVLRNVRSNTTPAITAFSESTDKATDKAKTLNSSENMNQQTDSTADHKPTAPPPTSSSPLNPPLYPPHDHKPTAPPPTSSSPLNTPLHPPHDHKPTAPPPTSSSPLNPYLPPPHDHKPTAPPPTSSPLNTPLPPPRDHKPTAPPPTSSPLNTPLPPPRDHKPTAPPPTSSPLNPPLPPPRDHIEHSADHLSQSSENEVSSDARLDGDVEIEPATKDAQRSINTGLLVKELEKTQKELSRLQQINKALQDGLQQEKERHLKEVTPTQIHSMDQVAFQRLQKTNQDLRTELEAQWRYQEEARQAELRRRVDILAQQAQLLVTGDATTLAQAQLEQDSRVFKEKELELEQTISSLKAQLQTSEEKRVEAEARLTQVQQQVQGLCDMQQEANQLRENYQEVSSQLRAYEDTQAQKEALLEQHLLLLQASQERERRTLAASLAQAEKQSQELQEQLERAKQQVESCNKSQEWTKEIQEAQEQLQEELQQTVSTMQELREEKELLDNQCQELQSLVQESNGEVSRLQDRLKSDETQFYNLEHSYERVCEELQVAMGKVRQWETEAQDMREGYERQLDQKEQELTEVLLKMEVLGNSLEETEMRLNEVLNTNETDNKQVLNNAENSSTDVSMRLHSRSIDQSLVPGDDPERFASIIQVLETKLYVTEEKLRDITQTLEDYQNHVSCQDPLLCSQLTQTRANAQHLGLLLHNQAKNNQRFAQDMENRCRMLVGRFQVALNIVQACRGRLQEAGSLIDVENFEKQLSTLVNCLKQGEKDAEKQQHESRHASKEEERILSDRTLSESTRLMEGVSQSVGHSLSQEIFVVETMATLLQSRKVSCQLQATQQDVGSLSQRYEHLLRQIMDLKAQSRNEDLMDSAVSRACLEGELLYKVFNFQVQNSNLEDHHPSEPESCDDHTEIEDRSMHDQTKQDQLTDKLASMLNKRAALLHQLSQDMPETITGENTDLKWVQERAKCIYLTHRLYLDLKQESDNQCSEQELKETLCHLEEVNCVLREELQHAEQRVRVIETGNQKLSEDMQDVESLHERRVQKLEREFQEKIRELQRIHEEEMKHLHDYYSKSCFSKEKLNKITGKSTSSRGHDGDAEEQAQSQRVSCLEQMHQKLVSDLQQQHQEEVSKVLKEKERLLKEETAATMAAIVAMRRSHKEEVEKTRHSTRIRETADVSELSREHEKEVQSLKKDLEELSVQHTHKCIENSQLSHRLTALIRQQSETQIQTEDFGRSIQLTADGADSYEMEVMFRAREAEKQFLRQEAESLKEELKLAQMDTLYTQNKLKALCVGTSDERLYGDFKCGAWSQSRQIFPEENGIHQSEAAVQDEAGSLSLCRSDPGL